MKPRARVGIDVGGTFTDLFLFDEASGSIATHKVSSTPDDPHRAPIHGLQQLFTRTGVRGEDVVFIGLGTTVATNLLLESKGARTGLITTKGFRDLLEIARQKRPHLYDPFVQKPKLLVPRELRCEVTERVGADGQVVAALSEAELLAVIAYLKQHDVESIAVCFLNSYANPAHEARAVAMIKERWPGVHVVSSYDVVPEFREYERLVSTVVNAYLMPRMRDYFARFESDIMGLSIPVQPVIMSSSGGVFSPALAGMRPIDTLFSGPSGGVSGAVFVSGRTGRDDVITFDMGGTSTEVCLVRGGRPQLTHARTVNGYPIRTTSHDIHTIGAGGSSIALVDVGGMLQVGPESAGASPGPACYPSGGAYATVTDANVVLGRLNRQYLLGGSLRIDASKSESAIQQHVAARKGIGVREAATSILALAEANMMQALRAVSVERGIDPKDFFLLALGGAGPLHAAVVAREVGMAGVLVPAYPGVLCAMGVLTKDIQLNFSRTKLVDASASDAWCIAAGAFADLESSARSSFAHAQGQHGEIRYERSAAARYRGQNHELSVDVPATRLDRDGLLRVEANFHAAHRELYGYCFPDNPVELVTLRLAAIIAVERPALPQGAAAGDAIGDPAVNLRMVSFDGEEETPCPVLDRSGLVRGQSIPGPAIVEQMDATTVIPPGFRACVDAWSNLVIAWS